MYYQIKKQKQFYICPNCLKVFEVVYSGSYSISPTNNFDTDYEIYQNNPCAIYCKECEEYTFRCDRLMIPIIIAFNKLNLKTEFCCSGHLNINQTTNKIEYDFYPDAYIVFKNELIYILSDGFNFKYWYIEDGRVLRLNKKYSNLNMIDVEHYKKSFYKYRVSYMHELKHLIQYIENKLDILQNKGEKN